MKTLLCLSSILLLGSFASAATLLETTYNGGNGGGNGWTVFFDLTVQNQIVVKAMNVADDQSVGSPIGLEIYTRNGTSQGFEQSASGWNLVSSGNGFTKGTDIPSFVDLLDFNLSSGLHGIAVHYKLGDPSYTNGNGSNQVYSDSEITITTGSSTNSTKIGFDGSSVFNPRVWNGGIYYDPVPEPATLTILSLGAIALLKRKKK